MKRWVLAGTDYVYPRTTNKILEAYLKPKGVAAGGHHDQLHAVRPFRLADDRVATSRSSARPARRPRWSRPSTATPTCRSTRSWATRASRPTDIPVVAFSVGEEELAGLDTKPLVGHLAAWNYFMSVDTPENKAFIDKWHASSRTTKRVTNDPMEAHYIGFNMWVKAVEKAGTTDPDKVIDAHDRRGGAEPHRRLLGDDAEPPHHQAGADRRDPGRRPVRHRLRRRRASCPATNGRTISRARKDLISDWRAPLSCGNFNVKTGKCGGTRPAS